MYCNISVVKGESEPTSTHEMSGMQTDAQSEHEVDVLTAPLVLCSLERCGCFVTATTRA